MKKRIIAMACAAVLSLSAALPAFAAFTPSGYGYGCCAQGTGYGLMRDEDGNFFDREVFEAKLDSLIEAGEISEDDRDYYVEMYEWCAGNGGGIGVRGRGRGCGIGRGW